MNELNLNQKVREIISFFKLSDNAFSKRIGVTQSVIGSMFQKGTEPSAKVIKLTLSAFPEISAEWMLRDNGSMLLSDEANDESVERLSMLVDTITTLQGTINELTKANKLLIDENSRLKGELTMIKNERIAK